MPLSYLEELESSLNKYVKKVEEFGDVQCLIIEKEVLDLENKAKRYYIFFTELNVDAEILSQLKKLINQIHDFYNYITDTVKSKFPTASI